MHDFNEQQKMQAPELCQQSTSFLKCAVLVWVWKGCDRIFSAAAAAAAGAAGVYSEEREGFVWTIQSGAFFFFFFLWDKSAHTRGHSSILPQPCIHATQAGPTCLSWSLQRAVLIGGLSPPSLIAMLSAPLLRCHFARAFQSDSKTDTPITLLCALTCSRSLLRLCCQVTYQTAAGTKRAVRDEMGEANQRSL